MNLLPWILLVFLVTLDVCHGPSVNFAEDYGEEQLSLVKRAGPKAAPKAAKAPKAPASAPKKKPLKELMDEFMNKPRIQALRVRSEKGKSMKGRLVAEPIVGTPRKRDLLSQFFKLVVGRKSCALPNGKVLMSVDHKGFLEAVDNGEEQAQDLRAAQAANVKLELEKTDLQLVGNMLHWENERLKSGTELDKLVIAVHEKAIAEDKEKIKALNDEVIVQAKKTIQANSVVAQKIKERRESSERHVTVVGQKDREITDLKTEKSALAQNVEELTTKSNKLAEDLRVTIAAKEEVEKFRDDLKLQRERMIAEGKADQKEIQRLLQEESRLLGEERELQNERRNLQEKLITQGEEVKRLMDKITGLTGEKESEKAQKEKNQETINRLDRELQALKVWQASTEEQIKSLNQREKDLLAQMSAKDTQHEKEKGDLKSAHAEVKAGLEGQLKLSEQSNNTLTSRIAVLDNEAKHLTGQLTDLQAAKVFLDSRVKELESDKTLLTANGAAKEAELKRETEAVKAELAKIDKEKAVIEVQKAEHMKDITQLRADIAKQEKEYDAIVNQLKVDVTKAKGQTETETKLNASLVQQINEKEKNLKELQAKVGNAESVNSRLSLELGELRERADKLARDLAVGNERHAYVEKALTEKVADLTIEKALLAQQITTLEQGKDAVTTRLTYIEIREKELNGSVTELKTENAVLKTDAKNAAAKNTETAAELKLKKEENDRFHAQLKILQEENAAQTKAIADLNKELGNEKEKKGTAEGINLANKDRLLDLTNKIAEMTSQQAKNLERIGELDRHITKLNIEKGDLMKDVDDLKKKANALQKGNQENEDHFTQQAQELMAKIASRDGTIERLREEYKKSLQQTNDANREKIAEQLKILTNQHTEMLSQTAAKQEQVFNVKLERLEKESAQKIKELKEAELKDWEDAYTAIKNAFKDKSNWCDKPLAKAWFTLFQASNPNPAEKIEPEEMATAVMGIMNNFIDKKRVDLITPFFRRVFLAFTTERYPG